MNAAIIEISLQGMTLSKLMYDFTQHIKNRDIDEVEVNEMLFATHLMAGKLLNKCLKPERNEREMALITPTILNIFKDTVKYIEAVEKDTDDTVFDRILPLLHDEDLNQTDLTDEQKKKLIQKINEFYE